ncbi:MAG: hypothetical protein HGA22_10280, partial [Clostridiales bacterium]|nr:hypothetical protein [Clostridiales bacterium]
GFCKPGQESPYNIHMIGDSQTIIAMGAGAVSKALIPWEGETVPGTVKAADSKKYKVERIFNVKNVEEYIKRVDEMVNRKGAAFNGL